MKNCFEDCSGISEIDSLLAILIVKQELENVDSEKGDVEEDAEQFSNTSMFGVVEELYSQDEYLFCDDYGTEWADHIAIDIENRSISFIHSKHGEVSSSASNLHDVVGQGIKNLGNMIFTLTQFMTKAEKFRNYYKNSNIHRTRRGDLNSLGEDLQQLLSEYNVSRKCILSCSFLSKEMVSEEFGKIKNQQDVRGHIIQLLWIISSFAHAARDMNITPIIYCKP